MQQRDAEHIPRGFPLRHAGNSPSGKHLTHIFLLCIIIFFSPIVSQLFLFVKLFVFCEHPCKYKRFSELPRTSIHIFATKFRRQKSTRRDSNPRPSPWQGDTPPLSHSCMSLFLNRTMIIIHITLCFVNNFFLSFLFFPLLIYF